MLGEGSVGQRVGAIRSHVRFLRAYHGAGDVDGAGRRAGAVHPPGGRAPSCEPRRSKKALGEPGGNVWPPPELLMAFRPTCNDETVGEPTQRTADDKPLLPTRDADRAGGLRRKSNFPSSTPERFSYGIKRQDNCGIVKADFRIFREEWCWDLLELSVFFRSEADGVRRAEMPGPARFNLPACCTKWSPTAGSNAERFPRKAQSRGFCRPAGGTGVRRGRRTALCLVSALESLPHLVLSSGDWGARVGDYSARYRTIGAASCQRPKKLLLTQNSGFRRALLWR
jgi:hypothetical protein